MSDTEKLDLSDEEMAVVKVYAEKRGLTIDEAASEMASLELERRMKKKVRRRPAKNVVDFRQKKTRQ